MKISELREKSLDDLKTLLDEKQLDSFRLRMAKATGQLSKTHEVKANRRLVARIKTLIASKNAQSGETA